MKNTQPPKSPKSHAAKVKRRGLKLYDPHPLEHEIKALEKKLAEFQDDETERGHREQEHALQKIAAALIDDADWEKMPGFPKYKMIVGGPVDSERTHLLHHALQKYIEGYCIMHPKATASDIPFQTMIESTLGTGYDPATIAPEASEQVHQNLLTVLSVATPREQSMLFCVDAKLLTEMQKKLKGRIRYSDSSVQGGVGRV